MSEGMGRASQMDDVFFRPANEHVLGERGEEARPMADLAATAHHNDKFGEDGSIP